MLSNTPEQLFFTRYQTKNNLQEHPPSPSWVMFIVQSGGTLINLVCTIGVKEMGEESLWEEEQQICEESWALGGQGEVADAHLHYIFCSLITALSLISLPLYLSNSMFTNVCSNSSHNHSYLSNSALHLFDVKLEYKRGKNLPVCWAIFFSPPWFETREAWF